MLIVDYHSASKQSLVFIQRNAHNVPNARPYIHSFIHFFIANKCQNAFAVTYD